MCQQLASKVAFFSSTVLFLHPRLLWLTFSTCFAYIALLADTTYSQPFAEGHASDKSVVYIQCWLLRLFSLKKVLACVAGGIASRVAG